MSKVKSVEEYYDLCFSDRSIAGVGSKEGFVYGFNHFREVLKNEFPDFSEEELLKILTNYHHIGSLFKYHSIQYFLQALEIELSNKNSEES